MFLYKQVTLNINREVRNSLQEILGVGWYKSILVCSKLGLSYPFSCGNLNSYSYHILSLILDSLTLLEIRIKRYIFENISRTYEIQCYRGFRHKDSLPSRGQRTRTNACTKKKIIYNLTSPIIIKKKDKDSKVSKKVSKSKLVKKK